MADETATLRDSVVNDNAAADTTTTTSAATTEDTSAAAALALEDVDALEIGRILRDSGVTKDRVNDLLSAPGALNSLRHMVVNNQREFLNMLERTDPAAATKFLDSMADIYLERNKSAAAGDTKTAPETAGLMAQIAKLSEQVNASLTREQQRDNAAMVAAVKSRYESRVDDMLNQDGIKALKLTKSQTKAFRADLDQRLGSDPSAVQRINAGNFVDVPRVFKGIVDEWTNDFKSAADQEKSDRERVERNASVGYPLGADTQLFDIPANASDSWEATEEALAKAIQRSMGGKK